VRPDGEGSGPRDRPGTLDGPNLDLPAGRADFDLPLGRVLLRILDLPTSWDPFVAEHYTPFALPAATAPAALTVRVKLALGPDEIPLPPFGELPHFEFHNEDGRHLVRSHWSRGWIDPARGAAELTLTSRRYLPFRISLENFLRIACQTVLLPRGAFLVHGAGIVDRGRCFLFFGPHDAGKSRIAELSQPRPALSDDIVLIDGSAAQVIAFPVPFWGAFAPTQRAQGEFPLALVCRVRDHGAAELTPLALPRAVASLAANLVFVDDLELSGDVVTEVVAGILRRVPAFEVGGLQRDELWARIAGL
jgi:hypothetical protein